MVVSQILTRVDDTMHIRLHQIRNDIDIFIAGLARRFGNIDELNNVFMLEKFQKFDLTNDSLRID